MPKKYRVGFAPSSDEIVDYSTCNSYKSAAAKAARATRRGVYTTWISRSFNTIEERDAFIEGLNEGLGWLGDPQIYTNN